MKGLDKDRDVTAQAGCIQLLGYTFVCGYLNRTTKSEVAHISSVGLYNVSAFETDPTSYGYFSAVKGVDDANEARDCAHALGQPLGTPIYFAVDFNASLAEANGEIADYFRAVRETINRNGNGPYKIGCYGNGTVLAALTSLGLIEYRWLSMSTDWYGSAGYTDWHIKQTGSGSVCGVECDFDTSNGDAGGWKV